MIERSSYKGRNKLSSFEVAVFFLQALWGILSFGFKNAIPIPKLFLDLACWDPFCEL